MAEPDKQAIKNMYKYLYERIEGQLSKTSVVLVDTLNNIELFRSLVQKSIDDVKALRTEVKESLEIIDRNCQ